MTYLKRITGVEVSEATTEVAATTGAVVQVFTTGTMVRFPTWPGCPLVSHPTRSFEAKNLAPPLI
jgi:hypothetical protein